jgi:hypothetical protein
VDWAADRSAPGREAGLDVEGGKLCVHEAGPDQRSCDDGEEVGDIRRHEHLAGERESPCQVGGKGRRRETALVMAPFPPGIGKIEMVRGDATVWDEPSHDTAGVAAEYPRVPQGRLLEGRGGGGCESGGALEAEEVAVRRPRSHRAEKLSAGAADLHFDGPIVAEDGAPWDRLSTSGRGRPWRFATTRLAVEDAEWVVVKAGDAGSGHGSIGRGSGMSGVATALRAKKSIAF